MEIDFILVKVLKNICVADATLMSIADVTPKKPLCC